MNSMLQRSPKTLHLAKKREATALKEKNFAWATTLILEQHLSIQDAVAIFGLVNRTSSVLAQTELQDLLMALLSRKTGS